MTVVIKFNREFIREKLITLNNWLITDIDDALSVVYSTRFIIRKYLTNKPINDMLLVNNIISASNILGFNISREIFSKVLDEDELLILNSIYIFIGLLGNNVSHNQQFYYILEDRLERYKKTAQ